MLLSQREGNQGMLPFVAGCWQQGEEPVYTPARRNAGKLQEILSSRHFDAAPERQ